MLFSWVIQLQDEEITISLDKIFLLKLSKEVLNPLHSISRILQHFAAEASIMTNFLHACLYSIKHHCQLFWIMGSGLLFSCHTGTAFFDKKKEVAVCCKQPIEYTLKE
jgi:hypothetical protein